jgi:tetratricopeptide (TPR) repeat protein
VESLHSICLKLKDRTRAQVYTERFLGVCSDNAAAHLANARNYGSVNLDRDRILAAVAAALRNPGSSAEFWREVAKLQSDVMEYVAACDSARRAITLDPDDIEIRELLISSLGVLRRKPEIRKECELLGRRLVQAELEDPLRWARLARIAAEAGASKQSKAYIDVAARFISNVDHGAEVELIRALILTGQPKRVMKYLDSLLSTSTQNTWLWKTLIELAMSRRYYDIVSKSVAGLKAVPNMDPELLYRISLIEKTISEQGSTGLKDLLYRWLRLGARRFR